MAPKKIKPISATRLRLLKRDIQFIRDEHYIYRRAVGDALSIDEATFSKMLKGERPAMLSKRFIDLRTLLDDVLSDGPAFKVVKGEDGRKKIVPSS